VPVIVITGSVDQPVARQARAGGAFAVVGKPIDFDALEVLVAQAMRLAPRP
jgi:DNA-binding NtrC family response regulator